MSPSSPFLMPSVQVIGCGIVPLLDDDDELELAGSPELLLEELLDSPLLDELLGAGGSAGSSPPPHAARTSTGKVAKSASLEDERDMTSHDT